MSTGRANQNTQFIRGVIANGGSPLKRWLRTVNIAEAAQQRERDRVNRLRSEKRSVSLLYRRCSRWAMSYVGK